MNKKSGVGLYMSKCAAAALIGWKSISERLVSAFPIKSDLCCNSSIIYTRIRFYEERLLQAS